jgi:hypothetical protein
VRNAVDQPDVGRSAGGIAVAGISCGTSSATGEQGCAAVGSSTFDTGPGRTALHRLIGELLATDRHFPLGPWLAQARAAGVDAAEQARLTYDVKILLTSWGERAGHQEGLHDYANRSWQGLLGDFYYSRWQTYFASLDTALATGNPPAEIDWFTVNEAWARDPGGYPVVPHGDTYRLATRVWAELPLG